MSETQEEAPGQAQHGAAPEAANSQGELRGAPNPQRDAGRQPSDAPAQPEGKSEGEAEPEAKEKPEREPWFTKRIAELTRLNEEKARVLAQAERELQRYRPAPDPNAPPDVEALATQRAAELVAEREYNAACNASHAAGVAAFPDFGEAMQQLAASGGIPRPLIEAALETGEAHKVLYALGRDPEEAMRIGGLTPARMGVALAKLAAKPVAPPAVTRAPSPVRSIGGGSAKPAEDPERMSMDEFSAWRAKQLAAKSR